MPSDAPAAPTGEWFHAKDGQACGPYPAGLLMMILRGTADPGAAQVRQDEAEPWRRVDDVPELAARLRARAPSGPEPRANQAVRASDVWRRNRDWRLTAAEPRTADDYLSRHWRGELSLAQSYWLNNVLIGWVIGAVLLIAATQPIRWLDGAWAVLGLTALPVLAWVACQVWLKVGTWRSAGRSGRPGRAATVRVLLVLGWIGIVATPLSRLAPLASAAFGGTMLPVPGAVVRAGGARIDLYGVVGPALTTSFRQALSAAPGATLVRLQGPGGSVGEAREIMAMIGARGLDTEAVGDCASACTLIFFAGHRRSLADGARLGFHSYRSPTMTPAALLEAEAHEEREFRAAGVPVEFVQRVFATPPSSIWYPSRAELAAAHFLSDGTPPPEIGAAPQTPPGALPLDPAGGDGTRTAITPPAGAGGADANPPGLEAKLPTLPSPAGGVAGSGVRGPSGRPGGRAAWRVPGRSSGLTPSGR